MKSIKISSKFDNFPFIGHEKWTLKKIEYVSVKLGSQGPAKPKQITTFILLSLFFTRITLPELDS